MQRRLRVGRERDEDCTCIARHIIDIAKGPRCWSILSRRWSAASDQRQPPRVSPSDWNVCLTPPEEDVPPPLAAPPCRFDLLPHGRFPRNTSIPPTVTDHHHRRRRRRRRKSSSVPMSTVLQSPGTALRLGGRPRRQCPQCDRTFTRTEHLERHVRSHTRDKPFQCPSCNKRYTRR